MEIIQQGGDQYSTNRGDQANFEIRQISEGAMHEQMRVNV